MVKIPQRFHQWRAVKLFIKTATFWAFKVSTVAQCDLIYWRTLDDPMLMSRFREWFVWIEPRKQNRLTFRQPAVNTATVDPLLSLTARAPNYWLPMCKKLKYWNTLATPQKRCCMTRRDCATETMIFSWPECDTCDFFSRATIGRIVCQTKWHKTPIQLPIPKLVQTNSDLW